MASSSSDTATLQAQLAEARAEAEKAKKSALRWKSKHDAVKDRCPKPSCPMLVLNSFGEPA